MPTTFQIALANHLNGCRFAPRQGVNGFVSSVRSVEESEQLSPKQHIYLCKLAHRYRRQIENKTWPERAKQELTRYDHGREAWELMLDEQEPDTRDTRLIYADWLDQNGLAHDAEVQRFFVSQGIQPELKPAGMSFGAKGNKGCNYHWYLWRSDLSSLCQVGGVWHDTRASAEESYAIALKRCRK